MKSRSFDRLARVYRLLEYLAFGRDLEHARFCFLEKLRDRREILVLGEGDGRCLAQIARLAPAARIDCLDLSSAMLSRAAARLPAEARTRVAFRQADLLTAELPSARYDAAVTFFFLDCFSAAQAEAIIHRVSHRLRDGGLWLWADFAMPRPGLARWRAQFWLRMLYAFFRWQTGISARVLPPAEELILATGLRRESEKIFQCGLVRSAVFSQPASGTCSS